MSGAVSSPLQADVLIVGAGPAGAALGYLLRKAGLDTLIVDAADTATKDKLCGGALKTPAVERFEDIYGAGSLAELEPYVTRAFVYHVLDKHVTEEMPFVVVPRARFDAYCVGRYLAKEGRLIDCARLRALDTAAHVAYIFDARAGAMREIRYRVLVGADGAGSVTRLLACGYKPRTSPALQGETAAASPDVIAGLRPAEQGVCWYIPQGGRAVVGVLFHGEKPAYCKKRLAEFCAELGCELTRVRGAVLPTGDDVALTAGEDTYFVGDAAGLIDAFTGSGIHHALFSAQALAAALTGGAPYEAAMADTVAAVTSEAAAESTANFLHCLSLAMRG